MSAVSRVLRACAQISLIGISADGTNLSGSTVTTVYLIRVFF